MDSGVLLDKQAQEPGFFVALLRNKDREQKRSLITIPIIFAFSPPLIKIHTFFDFSLNECRGAEELRSSGNCSCTPLGSSAPPHLRRAYTDSSRLKKVR